MIHGYALGRSLSGDPLMLQAPSGLLHRAAGTNRQLLAVSYPNEPPDHQTNRGIVAIGITPASIAVASAFTMSKAPLEVPSSAP
jgi:hypothetical protein